MKHKKQGKRGQEEIVGFALIIIIVAVVILFLLSFSLKSSGKEEVEDTEISSFVQAALQYTTDCEVNSGNLSLQDLIFDCMDEGVCLDERNSCDVLNSTWKGIVGESWKAGSDRPVKGYNLLITGDKNTLVDLNEGIVTKNRKAGQQSLARSFGSAEVVLRIYY